MMPKSGEELSTALQELLQTFAAKQKAERPQRWKNMEFRIKGTVILQGGSFNKLIDSSWERPDDVNIPCFNPEQLANVQESCQQCNPSCQVGAGRPGESELEFLEIFCNPNSATSAFNAKALITLRTQDGVKVTTEGRLSALKEDLDAFLQQHT